MTETITSTVVAKWIVLSLASFFGGIAHVLVEFRKGRIKNRKDGYALLFISSFAGACWAVIAYRLYSQDIPLVIFAGMFGGFMSLEGLAFIWTVITNKFLTK